MHCLLVHRYFLNKNMSHFRRICQLPNLLCVYYKEVLYESKNLPVIRIQICQYTRKSPEEILGIEKPKRPLNPFFKFMIQMRPALHTKIPGMSVQETVVWCSKHWQQLDQEVKSQLKKEYEEELENFKKKKAAYEATLTEEQKGDIKRLSIKMASSLKKRKLKSEFKEMEKPKKPMSSYILYIQSRNNAFQSTQLKKYQEKMKEEWLMLPESERAKFNRQAQDLMVKYKKDMEAWELKMISMGHLHLVSRKPQKKKVPQKNKVSVVGSSVLTKT